MHHKKSILITQDTFNDQWVKQNCETENKVLVIHRESKVSLKGKKYPLSLQRKKHTQNTEMT